MAALYGSLEPQTSETAFAEDSASTTVLNRRRRRAIAFSVASIASLAVVATVGLTARTSVAKLPSQTAPEVTVDEAELRYVSMTTGASIPGGDQISRPNIPSSDSIPSYSFGDMFGLTDSKDPKAPETDEVAAENAFAEKAPTSDKSKLNTACLASDEARIYKYTIASSLASADAVWAESMFGCSYDSDLSYTCEKAVDVGKITCLNDSFAFDVHFIYNNNTNAGPMDVPYWDSYMVGLHEESFRTDTYNAFMDFSMSFYTPDINKWLQASGVLESKKFLARKMFMHHEWQYSILVSSPGGKIFEILGGDLNETTLGFEVSEWATKECPSLHHTVYTLDQMATWYKQLVSDNSTYPQLIPVRSTVAVEDTAAVSEWYAKNFPGVGRKLVSSSSETCDVISSNVGIIEESDFEFQIKFVNNPDWTVMDGKHSVNDFIDYMVGVNKQYGGINEGWSAWYDRHLGIQVYDCSLDDYMQQFTEVGTNFHPHGRDASNIFGTEANHVWTEGTQGWGIEIQGDLAYTYADCYSAFDWCTASTDPAEDDLKYWSCE